MPRPTKPGNYWLEISYSNTVRVFEVVQVVCEQRENLQELFYFTKSNRNLRYVRWQAPRLWGTEMLPIDMFGCTAVKQE